MRLSRPRRAAGLWCACAAACVMAAPAQAQAPSPVQGAREALTRARQAKNLSEMNNSLTNESAATLGFGLVLADSMMSGLATTMTDALTPEGAKPKAAAGEEASEKAFQAKVEALLKRYSLDEKTFKGAGESETLPPTLIAHGHQFLADAIVLSDGYEKSHTTSKSGRTLGGQMGGSALPMPGACDFRVLSPSRVQIVPRANPKSTLEARLEDGQWRLDAGAGPSPSSGKSAGPKPITPRSAALLQSISDQDATAVARELKAEPSLASSPQAFTHGTSGILSSTPLSEAMFWGDPKTVALLLRYGANVGAEDAFGQNALDEAVEHGHKEVVALLLAHGAKAAHKDGRGRTALHIAAESSDNDIAAPLLVHGADVNARDEDGKTPLALALASSNSGKHHDATLSLLRQHGGKK